VLGTRQRTVDAHAAAILRVSLVVDTMELRMEWQGHDGRVEVTVKSLAGTVGLRMRPVRRPSRVSPGGRRQPIGIARMPAPLHRYIVFEEPIADLPVRTIRGESRELRGGSRHRE
jgi:ABC-type lipoprotein export system ATPase subunit